MENYLLLESEFNEVKEAFAANSENLVDARRVHEWLGVKTQFSKWVQKRIQKYQFERGVDYQILIVKSDYSDKINNLRTGRAFEEYLCSPDMVKHLAMVESTEKGKQVRKYYIDVATRAQELFELQNQMNRLTLLDSQTFNDASAGSRAMLRRKAFLNGEAKVFEQLLYKSQARLFDEVVR